MIDEPEEKEPARRLSDQIRHAFEGAIYPEGDNIYAGEDFRDYDGVKRDFHGKTWQEIKPEILSLHRDDLALFTRPALTYFLPAFMLEDLKINDVSKGEIQQFLIYQITDAVEREKIFFEAWEAGSSNPYPNYIPNGNDSHVNGDGMTAEQIRAVRDYLGFIHWTYDYSQESAVYYALLHHWRPLYEKAAERNS